ncbi:hypothetical protein Tco_1124896 [Tanacetum coccineum]|uniref:Uncharacterized protein n=1 Tax=Tanacetum coccineum TaxID=301880 RepID=A0ABQ5J8K0_9ASTR
MAWTRRIILLPVALQTYSFASILPLVRLLLVLIVLGSVIQLPLVLSLAFRKSADLFVHTFLKIVYWHLFLKCHQTFHTHNENLYVIFNDSTFSGGGNGEGSAAALLVMHALVDDDVSMKQTHQSQMPMYSHLEGTRSSIGTAEGSVGARCSSSSFSTSSSSLSSLDDSLS